MVVEFYSSLMLLILNLLRDCRENEALDLREEVGAVGFLLFLLCLMTDQLLLLDLFVMIFYIWTHLKNFFISLGTSRSRYRRRSIDRSDILK